VKISELAMKQSRYLCWKIPNNEWVGALIYEFKGNWENETLEINVLDIYPMYEANGMSFEGNFNFDFNYAIDKGYDIENIRLGLIHSHCQSSVFFSNPDMDELKTTSKIHPFYLSLITNNNNEWTGKICIHNKLEYSKKGISKYKDINGYVISSPFEEKVVEESYKIFDVKILQVKQDINDNYFLNRLDSIIEDKKNRDLKINQLNKRQYANYGLDEIIESFFTDDLVDFHFLISNEQYGVNYKPELLISFVHKFNKNYNEYSIINRVIKEMKSYNTSFTKELIKDYESYIKKK